MLEKLKLSPIFKEVISQALAKPATRKYPEVRPQLPEGSRGRQLFDIRLCISCGLCARDCPAKAIEMVDAQGKKRPLFHLDLCIFCYQCADSCPRNAIAPSDVFELSALNKNSMVVRPDEGIEQNTETAK